MENCPGNYFPDVLPETIRTLELDHEPSDDGRDSRFQSEPPDTAAGDTIISPRRRRIVHRDGQLAPPFRQGPWSSSRVRSFLGDTSGSNFRDISILGSSLPPIAPSASRRLYPDLAHGPVNPAEQLAFNATLALGALANNGRRTQTTLWARRVLAIDHGPIRAPSSPTSAATSARMVCSTSAPSSRPR